MSESEKSPLTGEQEGHQKNNNNLSPLSLPVKSDLVNILSEIKELPLWVCGRNGGSDGKERKRPISPRTGRPAAENNPDEWTTFKEAQDFSELHKSWRLADPEFVLGDHSFYWVTEIYNCLDPQTGKLKPRAEEIVSKIDSYTEFALNGQDLIIILRGKTPFSSNRSSSIGLGIYIKNHFCPLTGNVRDGFRVIKEITPESLDYLKSLFDQNTPSLPTPPHGPVMAPPAPSLTDEEIIDGTEEVEKGDSAVEELTNPTVDHNQEETSFPTIHTDNPEGIENDQKEIACELSEDEGVEPKPPELSEEALYGIPGEFVKLATADSEADPVAVLATFLARFGAEVGPDVYFRVGDTKHYTRIFPTIVGESAKSRKGTAAKPAERLFAFSAVRSTPGPLSSGEGLIYAVRNASESYSENYDPGVKDKRLFVLDEEFGSALTCMQRQGNTLSTVIRSAWDCGDLDPLTKHSKISATGAHIVIVSHITRYELNLKMNKVEVFNGFANRVLWVYARRKKRVALPSPMPEPELLVLQDKLKKNLEKVSGLREIRFSQDAETLWKEVYDELSEDHPGLLGCVIARAEAQVVRLAMIYCLTDGLDKIEVHHLKAALAFWKYCVKSSMLIFGGRETDPILQRIVDFLKTGPKSKTEIHSKFSNHIKGQDLDFALKELQKTGRIIIEKLPTKGAPKFLYKFNRR